MVISNLVKQNMRTLLNLLENVQHTVKVDRHNSLSLLLGANIIYPDAADFKTCMSRKQYLNQGKTY